MYVNSDSLIEQAISSLISHHFPPSELLNKCFQHLITILSNLLEKPEDEKFRLIKKTNEKILREVLIFQEAIEFLYFIGFEEIDIDSTPCLIYNGGVENKMELELALKVLRNKQRNEIFNNYEPKNESISSNKPIVKDSKDIAMEKEIQNRKKEIEEMKQIKEQIIKDFESNKKYNLEVKKASQNDQKNTLSFKRSSTGNNVVLGSNNPNNLAKEEVKIIPKKDQFRQKAKKRNTLGASAKKNTNTNSNPTNQPKKSNNKKVVSLKDYGKIE